MPAVPCWQYQRWIRPVAHWADQLLSVSRPWGKTLFEIATAYKCYMWIHKIKAGIQRNALKKKKEKKSGRYDVIHTLHSARMNCRVKQFYSVECPLPRNELLQAFSIWNVSRIMYIAEQRTNKTRQISRIQSVMFLFKRKSSVVGRGHR